MAKLEAFQRTRSGRKPAVGSPMKGSGGDQPPDKPMLSTAALTQLLHEWQGKAAGSGRVTSKAALSKLVQSPPLRPALEYLVLHTIPGAKAREIRANLRLHNVRSTKEADAKCRSTIEKLAGRKGELQHLLEETKKAVARGEEDLSKIRAMLDTATEDRDVQRERLAVLRRKVMALRALRSVTAHASTQLRANSGGLPSLHNSAGDSVGVVRQGLDKLRQALGEDGEGTSAVAVGKVPPPDMAESMANAGGALSMLASLPPTAGVEVYDTVFTTLRKSKEELQTISVAGGAVPPSGSTAELQKLIVAGQQEHMRSYAAEEGLRLRAAEHRQMASKICKQILSRLDHQSIFVRQLTEARARSCGLQAQLRVIEEHARSLRGKGPAGHLHHRYIAEKEAAIESLRQQREAKCALSQHLLNIARRHVEASHSDGLASLSVLQGKVEKTKAAMATVSESRLQERAASIMHRVPGIGEREMNGLLEGCQLAVPVESVVVSFPTVGLGTPEKVLSDIFFNNSRRSAVKAREIDLAASLRKHGGIRDEVADAVSSCINDWQKCVESFGGIIKQIKEGRDYLVTLDGDFEDLDTAFKVLTTQPARDLAHLLQKPPP